MENQRCAESNGGQRGCASSLENQPLALSSGQFAHTEKIDENLAASNQIALAALWLHQHRSDISGAVIPVIKERFGLCNLDAIEATKQAHALAYSGAHG